MKKSILFAALTLAVFSAFAGGKHNETPPSGGNAYGGSGGSGYGVGVGVGVGVGIAGAASESNSSANATANQAQFANAAAEGGKGGSGGSGGSGGVGMGGSATGGNASAVGGTGGAGGAAAAGAGGTGLGGAGGVGTVAVNAVGSTYEAAASTAYAPDGKAPRTSCRLFIGLGGSQTNGSLSGGIPIANDQTCISGAQIEAMDKANKVYPGSFLIGDYLKAICKIEGMDATEGCKPKQ